MWYVNTSSCANSSKLFEPYDYETFRKSKVNMRNYHLMKKRNIMEQNTILPFRQVRN